MNQRWQNGVDTYRPAGEPFDPDRHEVAPLGEAAAKAFVVGHHYSASYPAARFRFGLYRGAALAGVAVFSHPANDLVLTNTFPGVSPLEAAELGRFVLLDEVEGNGESWFLGRCFRLLRRDGLAGVVSFSDPGRRTNAAGAVVFGGHWGCIYQAHNGRYLGRGTPRTHWLLPGGAALSPRAMQKVRAGERGRRYAAGLLVGAGAEPPRPGEDPRAWLNLWLNRLCRRQRHRGNHRYAWALDRRVVLPGGLPYPKSVDV